MQINSNYRLENKMTSTENRDTHTGAKHEVTDKVYFIKKDEMTNYAEAKFKSAILMTKKWRLNLPIQLINLLNNIMQPMAEEKNNAVIGDVFK